MIYLLSKRIKINYNLFVINENRRSNYNYILFYFSRDNCKYYINQTGMIEEIKCEKSEESQKSQNCSNLEDYNERMYNFIYKSMGYFLIFASSIILSVLGISGQLIYYYITTLLMKISLPESITITKTLTYINIIIINIVNLQKIHPFRSSIRLDYNVANLTIPLLLSGKRIGNNFKLSLDDTLPLVLSILLYFLILLVNKYILFFYR